MDSVEHLLMLYSGKCEPSAKIFTVVHNRLRSSPMTCRECCQNRSAAAFHRMLSVMPGCPLSTEYMQPDNVHFYLLSSVKPVLNPLSVRQADFIHIYIHSHMYMQLLTKVYFVHLLKYLYK